MTSGLPPGLSLNPEAGAITGTPTTAGASSLILTVTDANKATGEVSCSMTIAPMLTLACPGASTGYAGQPYSSSLVASGGTPPYTFAMTSGTLPPPLGLSPNGAISGTPTELGTFNFSASVTDSAGGMATTNCQITVAATFVITAIYVDASVSPPQQQGPAIGLNFVIAGTSQLVNAPEGFPGTYTVLGVTNGEVLGPGPAFGDYFLVTSTGINTYIIPVVLSGTSGSATVFVAYARPL